MEREAHCPVCRAVIRILAEHPEREYVWQICGTKFVLPLRRREAGGESDPDH
ncbi:MAG TPA: hypothetical protein PLL30_08755 [Candidatus Krumholzibacteria bacterium]|nr:hypothetical protein [Candidatus Krumholzibacteria bacterium]HPD71848.1 hypothetical protein [Candidatus Krumholzibacteria bacterium]HRY41219.1 hypothetical protein [Candidatus Krumholzibacteria bacterium]